VIDFDRNATTPLVDEAAAAMRAVLEDASLGNPSSVHRRGQRARAVVERGRRVVAACCGATASEVVFTSGGTEADGLALHGACEWLAAAGRPAGLACSAIEHPAVTQVAARLRRRGHPVATLPVDAKGRLLPDAIAAAIAAQPEIGVVAITAAHHELGNVTDVAGVVQAIRAVRRDVVVHVDAISAFGRIPVSIAAWDADTLAVAAHKIGGPVGIGALVVRRGTGLVAQIGGGQQQAGRRAGTESALLVAGFAAAAEVARARLPRWSTSVAPRLARLRAGLVALGAVPFGDDVAHLGNTALVSFPACDGHLVMMALDDAGFAVSTGAACSAGTIEPSAVVLGLGHSAAVARTAVRVSIDHTHTDADVDALLAALPDVLAKVRAATRRLGAAS
jgi:cysteine desulfurase